MPFAESTTPPLPLISLWPTNSEDERNDDGAKKITIYVFERLPDRLGILNLPILCSAVKMMHRICLESIGYLSPHLQDYIIESGADRRRSMGGDKLLCECCHRRQRRPKMMTTYLRPLFNSNRQYYAIHQPSLRHHHLRHLRRHHYSDLST